MRSPKLHWLTELLAQGTLPLSFAEVSQPCNESFLREISSLENRLNEERQQHHSTLEALHTTRENCFHESSKAKEQVSSLRSLLEEKDQALDNAVSAFEQLREEHASLYEVYGSLLARHEALLEKYRALEESAKLCPGDKRAIPSFPKAAMLWCPPGSFRMGSEASDYEAQTNEKPAHEVTLTRGFWMKQTPVTQGEWQAITGSNPSRFNECGLDAPVESVSWFDAVWFCNQLSKREGLPEAYRLEKAAGNLGKNLQFGSIEVVEDSPGYRLPTEAEWEYACRAGTLTSRYGKLDEVAWFKDSSLGGTQAVGQKKPNEWGFCDMLGNIWEWCCDRFAPYKAHGAIDPLQLQSSTSYRVERGGSWSDKRDRVRSASRSGTMPLNCRYDLGFRLARSD